MNDLHIEFGTGYIDIQDEFFPCGIQKFKKLLKIIALDFQHEKELKENLKAYFQTKISDLVEFRKENSRKYCDLKQKEAETRDLINSQRHPNGLRVSDDELKQLKIDLKRYTAGWKKALSEARKNVRFKDQFEKYLKLL